MKVTIPLGLLLLLAAAVGYAFGTEDGRRQRDVILVKVGRKGDDEQPVDSDSSDAAEPEPAEDEAAPAPAGA